MRKAALVAGSMLVAAACGQSGSSEAEARAVDAASETAHEALRTAEEALVAVERLESEVAQAEHGAPAELAMVEEGGHGAEEAAGHGAEEAAGHGAEEEAPAPKASGDVHWSYGGATGPDQWAAISEDFAVCESGLEQSPIDIAVADSFDVGLDDLELNWTPSDVTVVDNGHTIQANVAPGNTTVFDGVTYDLVQFHFHKPSEHSVDSETFPMELHFVHATPGGELAVIGVLLVQGEANPAFDGLFAADTELAGLDLTTLLPGDLSRFRYGGSLTTPPCSEGVNWNVLTGSVALSAEQIAAFTYEGNARPVQDLENRKVLADDTMVTGS